MSWAAPFVEGVKEVALHQLWSVQLNAAQAVLLLTNQKSWVQMAAHRYEKLAEEQTTNQNCQPSLSPIGHKSDATVVRHLH
jgi:hypothetical protein